MVFIIFAALERNKNRVPKICWEAQDSRDFHGSNEGMLYTACGKPEALYSRSARKVNLARRGSEWEVEAEEQSVGGRKSSLEAPKLFFGKAEWGRWKQLQRVGSRRGFFEEVGCYKGETLSSSGIQEEQEHCRHISKLEEDE